jgi:hypothetical protein
MIARTGLRVESRVSASPVWLRTVDTFTGGPPSGPLDVRIEKRDGATWIPLAVPHQISSSGDVGFLDLGRGRPGETGSFDVRITVIAPRTVADTPTGDPFVVKTVTVWAADSPPTPTAERVRFVPGPDYRFGPGVPLLSGRVVDAAGVAVERAHVTATETVRGSPVVEEVMTTADGWFRLPLRWSSGSTQIVAERGSLSGGTTITVPDDLPVAVTLTVT